MTTPPVPQLCLVSECEHHEDHTWARPPSSERPVYAAAYRARA